ncbi:MAG: adenylate/guanylate cyclase domain-containing protein [Kofleriaceae bacterium]|nr:adenylate/guanylate cyclase domain-containing protein [Kofleriaceae bacterium]
MSRQSVSLNPGRRSAPGGLLHRLASGVARDLETERFVTLVRNTVIVAFVLVVASEVAALVSPAFPRDVAATAVMAGTFVVVGAACVLGAPRSVVAALSVLMFGVLGWYVARAIGQSGGLGSPHRDAIYPVLAGASALLLFSAVEFTAVTLLFVGTAAATTQLRGDAELSELGLTGFYILSFYCLAMVGIVARARLKRSERQARDQLERLNHNLRAEVDAQVERIRRAETLSRYLPPELSEQVLAGEAGDELAHGHRQVAVLCASPVGFLETLTTLETDEVATLVNSFVSTMSRTAFEHGGVIERFVGPRLTVLFGSLAEQAPAESVRRAVAMARDMQRACNVLLRQWEHEGLPIRLRMAIGIAAGPSVVGTFGSERRFEYSALGEAMVRAHRLTATAIPGEVRLDGSAAAWVDDQEIGPGEQVEFVPGRPEPTFVVDPHRVERAAGEPEASDEAAALQAALLATNHRPRRPLRRPCRAGVARRRRPRPRRSGSTPRSPPGELPARRAARLRMLLEPGQLFDGRYRIDARIGRRARPRRSIARTTSRSISRARSSCCTPASSRRRARSSSSGARSRPRRASTTPTWSSSTTSAAASRATTTSPSTTWTASRSRRCSTARAGCRSSGPWAWPAACCSPCRPRTSSASSTATSSRATCWSTAAARPGSPTSAWPSRSTSRGSTRS